MDAATIQFASQPRFDTGRRAPLRLAAWIQPMLGAALVSAALAVATRRLAGGLTQPLLPAELCIASWGATLLAVGSRGFSRWLSSIALVTFVASLSLGGTPISGLIGAWGVVVVEEVWAWRRFRGGRIGQASSAERPPQRSGSEPSENPTVSSGASLPALSSGVAEASAIPSAELRDPSRPLTGPSFFPPPDISPLSAEMHQQLTRAHMADGADRLAGWLQATFAPGERTATVHVAFCPPFADVPKVTVRQTSGPATRLKPGQILTHGVRLELKLNFASRVAERVLVEFAAESRPAG